MTTEIVEADVVEDKALAPANLFGAKSGSDMVAVASERATALAGVVDKQKLFTNISGKKHVRVEGWTLLGSMLGVFPVTEWVHELKDEQERLVGFEARVEARTLEGNIVGAAVARCTKAENRWGRADDYAIESMAQTRATSKALRQPLGFVMQLAGYSATPAEEMDGVQEPPPAEQREGVPAASPPQAQPAAPSPAPSLDETAELRQAWWKLAQSIGFSSDDLKAYFTARYPLYATTKDLTADELDAEIAIFSGFDDMGAQTVRTQLAEGTFDPSQGRAPQAALSEDERKRYRRRLYAVAKDAGHDAAAVKAELNIASTNDLTREGWEAAIAHYEDMAQPPPTEG